MRFNKMKSQSIRRDPFYLPSRIAALFSVSLLIWIVGLIANDALPAIRAHGVSMIFSSNWNPNLGHYGIYSYLMGTLASSLIAIVIALPLGVMMAVFLSEDFLPPKMRYVFRFLIDLLAAIPSVVYGLWGIAVVVPLVQKYGAILVDYGGERFSILAGPAYGNSLLTASLVLALMILPTITAISRDALQSVPGTMRESAYSLGATRWESIWGVLIPMAAPGIIASAILALGRAMGETLAVAMLIGNSSRFSWSILSPAGTLAGLLVNQFAEAEGMVISVLMYAALILMMMTLVVNVIGSWVLRASRRMGRVEE